MGVTLQTPPIGPASRTSVSPDGKGHDHEPHTRIGQQEHDKRFALLLGMSGHRTVSKTQAVWLIGNANDPTECHQCDSGCANPLRPSTNPHL